MPPTATASHILVKSADACAALKHELDAGAAFADLAKKHSECPSGKKGGSLGQFPRGAMVPAFDKAVFEEAKVGEVTECVPTQFGYHLIKVEKRES